MQCYTRTRGPDLYVRDSSERWYTVVIDHTKLQEYTIENSVVHPRVDKNRFVTNETKQV